MLKCVVIQFSCLDIDQTNGQLLRYQHHKLPFFQSKLFFALPIPPPTAANTTHSSQVMVKHIGTKQALCGRGDKNLQDGYETTPVRVIRPTYVDEEGIIRRL